MLLIGYRLSSVGDKSRFYLLIEAFPIVNSAEIQNLKQACNEQSVENRRHNRCVGRRMKGMKRLKDSAENDYIYEF